MPFDRALMKSEFTTAHQAAGFGSPSFGAVDDQAADKLLTFGENAAGSLLSATRSWPAIAAYLVQRREVAYLIARPTIPLLAKYRDVIGAWSIENRGIRI